MIITPDSNVTLYKDVKIGAGEQIAFSSPAKQQAYFAKHKVTAVDNCTYVRRTGAIKLEYPTAIVSQCNYISFRNKAFENITFYAKILDYNYINNVTTEISYGIDYFQTYMFSVSYDQCGIERQHLSQLGQQEAEADPWTMTENTVELFTAENLAVTADQQEYQTAENTTRIGVSEKNSELCLVLQIAVFNSTQISSYDDFLRFFNLVVKSDGTIPRNQYGDPGNAFFKYPGGITPDLQGIFPRSYDMYVMSMEGPEPLKAQQKIFNWLELNGLASSVLGTFIMSKEEVLSLVYTWGRLQPGITPDSPKMEYAIQFPDKTKYVNKKLLTYPFSYLEVKCVMGPEKEFHWEYFENLPDIDRIAFLQTPVIMDTVPSRSVVPVHYKQEQSLGYGIANVAERIDSTPPNQIAYAADSYLTFLSGKYQQMAGGLGNVTEGLEAFTGTDIGAGLYITKSFINSALSLAGNIASGYKGDTIIRHDKKKGDTIVKEGYWGGAMSGASTVAGSSGLASQIAAQADASLAYNSMFMDGGLHGNTDVLDGKTPFSPFGAARQAYVASNYHAGSFDGAIASYVNGTQETPLSFYAIKRSLREPIMKMYDRFFSLYGYTSNRNDIPLVANFMNGSTEASKLPAWDTAIGPAQTYIKTSGCHVYGVIDVACRYIEVLYDNGMFVKNGDVL